MNNINFGRVLIGGLLAGLVLNIGEWLLNGVVLAKQMEALFQQLRVSPPGPSFFVVAILLTFVIGILLVLVYALARPRLGPGPKTAVIAALILWLGIYVYTGVLNGMLFNTAANLTIIAIVWGLFEYVIASIAGAWAYKE